jgi:hypothetical protein
VTGSWQGGLLRIDPAKNRVTQVTPFVGNGPAAVAVGFGSVWVVNGLDGTVSRVDPRKNAVAATIPIGQGASGLVVGKDSVWVSDEDSGTLSRIDPDENVVTDKKPVGDRPAGLALGPRGVYVAVRGPRSAHRGGILTVLPWWDAALDPARGYDSWSWVALTNDGLVAFKRAGGSEGTQLVPDLATSRPTPTDRGRTYTFRLRAGVRYSTGVQVRPATSAAESSARCSRGPTRLARATCGQSSAPLAASSTPADATSLAGSRRTTTRVRSRSI